MRSFSRLALLSLLGLFSALPLRGQTTFATTPVIDTPGSPDGSYQINDFESLNIPNGHLNLVFRLASAHGRGNLKLDVITRIEPAKWSFYPTPVVGNCGPNGCQTLGYNYNMTFGPPPAPGPDQVAGVVVQRPTGSQCGNGVMNGLNVSVWTNTTLTSVVWQKPDGTEVTFRDKQFGGQPQPGWHAGINSSQGANRGRTFVAMDGSSAIFTADSNVYDNYLCGGAIPIAVPGVLTLRDGTLYTFRSSQNGPSGTSGAYATQVEDRNGNVLTIAQNNPETVSDDLGRTITLGGTIQYPGQDGSVRNVTINSSSLQNALNSGESLTLMGNLFGGPNWGCYNGQQCGNSTTYNNPGVISQIILPNNQGYRFCYNHFGDVARLFLTTGGAIEYDYDTYLTSDGATPTDWTAFRFLIAKRVYNTIPGVTPANTCSADRSTFRLEQQIQYSDPLGNSSRIATYKDANGNSLGSETHHYNPVDLVPGNDGTHYPAWSEGLETELDYYDASGNLLKKDVNTWHQRPCYSWDVMCVPAWSSNPDGSTAWSHDPRMTVRQETYGTQLSEKDFGYANDNVNPYNNQTSVAEYDFGNSVRGNLIRTTTTTYNTSTNYTNLNIVGLPLTQTVTDAGGNQASSTSWTYDGGTLTNESGIIQHDSVYSTSFIYRGNPTSISRVLTDPINPSHNGTLTTTQTFDIAGNLVDAIDPRGVERAISYTDSLNSYAFPTSITRYPTLGSHTPAITETFTYNYNIARVSTHTDANGQSTTFSYIETGRMDRLTTVTHPDTGQSTFTYTDTPGNVNVLAIASMDGAHSLQKAVYYEGLGRVRQSQLVSDPDCTNGDRTDSTYDGRGRIYTVSNPYCTTSDSTYGLTTFTYDALGRTTQVTNPDNSTVLKSYTGRATQVQDEGNGGGRVTRISQTDALGRIVSVCEVSGTSLIGSGGTPGACGQDIAGTGFLTSYQYDALNNLLQANQAGIGPRTFVYDSLVRLVQAGNPESGTITYSYDASGNLATKTDARGIRTMYSYDGLNRLTGKTYSDGTPAATFNYDQSSALGVTLTNTVGRKSSQSTAGPNPTGSVFSYDTMGRISNNSQCTPQNCGTGIFAFQYTQYDFVGDLVSATNAVGVTFNYAYNTVARLTGMTTNFIDGSHPGTLFSNARYSPFGALTSATLGNGVAESWSYNKRLWQQSRTATFGATTPYSFNVATFAPNGDILAANDSANGNWSYSYDPFNRLLSANTTGQAYTYDYDRFSNRWHQNGPHSSQLGFDANNHITGVTGVGYDLSGNLTSDGSGPGTHTYFYDAENRIIQVDGTLGTCSTATACYIYNADGQRVRKTTGGSSMDYLYDLAGHKIADVDPTGIFMQGELYAGDRHFAIYAPEPGPTGATFFTHSDWLGTERVRTDMTGTNCESIVSLPFGDGQSITGTCGDVSPMHFTGKERDAESGLDNFKARYFGSSMGRFTRPDPIMISKQKLVDPQQWNMYSYARNNPLRFIDPTGKAAELTGNDEERKRQLAALQKAVGKQAGAYLYDNVDKKTGKHYVGIYTNGPDGKGPSFNSINAAANKLGGIIQDSRVASIQFVSPGKEVEGITMGSPDDKMQPGYTSANHFGGTIYLTSGDVGKLPGPLSSTGEPAKNSLADVLAHELGHLDSTWFHWDFDTLGDAVRMENQARKNQGEKATRTGHEVQGDVDLEGTPF